MRRYTVAELEDHIDRLKELVKRRDKVQRLRMNADFRDVIERLYFVDEAASFAAMSADPNMTAEQRADALAMAQAPGHLKRWFNVIDKMAETAEAEIASHQEMIEQIRAEEISEQ